MATKLRVGLLLDRPVAPAWAHLMLGRIAQSEHAELCFVVLNGSPPERPDFVHRLKTRWRHIPERAVWRVLNLARTRLMERVRCEPDAFRPVDLMPLLEGLPAITVQPERKRYSDYFPDEDLAKIAACRPDVLVRLGFRVLRGGILTVAKYGVWSYHHGDYLVNRGGPAGFWEAFESWPETGTVLQILTEDLDGGVILYQSWSLTVDRSVTLNNNERYWTSASFMPRMLDRLGSFGEEAFFKQVAPCNQPVFYCRRLYRKPGNAHLAFLLAKKLVVKLRRRLRRRVWFDQWCLLVAEHDGLATSLRRFHRIVPPRDRFWADPNVLYENGLYRIFIEEFLYARDKGHISLLTMDSSGNYRAPVKVIEEPHHISYPFVFRHAGELWMLVEAYDAKVVPLYRCIEFPHRWVFERNLLEDTAAVDPTLYPHGGKWYLFVGVAENPGSSPSTELFLYFADDPVAGNWKPHPLNPVISDVKSARPAGRIFEHNGGIFRPAQNCSHRYGYGITLNRIEVMSETGYREHKVNAIEPGWCRDITGTHTISHTHRLTVLDASLRRARYWNGRYRGAFLPAPVQHVLAAEPAENPVTGSTAAAGISHAASSSGRPHLTGKPTASP